MHCTQYAEGQPVEARKPQPQKPELSTTTSSTASTLIHSYDSGPVDVEDHDEHLHVTVYRGAETSVDETTGAWQDSTSGMLCCFNSASAYLQRTVGTQSALWCRSGPLQAITRRLSGDLLGPVPQHCIGKATVVLDLDGASAPLGRMPALPATNMLARTYDLRCLSTRCGGFVETLVHSSFTPIEDPDFVTTIEVDGALMDVHVNKRPWLDYFLKQVGPS